MPLWKAILKLYFSWTLWGSTYMVFMIALHLICFFTGYEDGGWWKLPAGFGLIALIGLFFTLAAVPMGLAEARRRANGQEEKEGTAEA